MSRFALRYSDDDLSSVSLYCGLPVGAKYDILDVACAPMRMVARGLDGPWAQLLVDMLNERSQHGAALPTPVNDFQELSSLGMGGEAR